MANKKAFIAPWTLLRTPKDVEQRGLPPVYHGPGALDALKRLLVGPLTRDLRDKQDEEVLTLVLTLYRNILHVPTSRTVRRVGGRGRAAPA